MGGQAAFWVETAATLGANLATHRSRIGDASAAWQNSEGIQLQESQMATANPSPHRPYLDDVVQAIDAAGNELIDISLDIHAHPELGNEEHHAAELLTGFLSRHGFEVEWPVAGIETAFSAVAAGSSNGPVVAVLAEYDALPDIGHGCGHNLIAQTAVGAGIGAQAALGALPGSVVVMGTPAEETDGAKIRMLEAGLFDDVDVVLSSHPASDRTIIHTDVPIGESLSLALVGYRYAYHGKAAHAASAPHEGVNALNALLHLFVGIDSLRQHLRDDARVHGVITHGGSAPNVVPEYAEANFLLRAGDREYLAEVVDKVRGVAEGAASMTGARLEILPGDPLYENVRSNSPLATAALSAAKAVGLQTDELPAGNRPVGASTDFGNVSHEVPSFAISFAISDGPVPGHSKRMTEAAGSELANRQGILVAKTIALAACDVLNDQELLDAARSDFAARSGG